MYRNVLLAVDLQHWQRYSAHALATREVATALARGGAHTLHVLSVYTYHEPSSSDAPIGGVASALNRWKQQTDDLMRRKVEEYTAPLQHEAFNSSIILRVGHPQDVIVQTARNLKIDLLVMGSHSKRGIVDIVLGGVARQVSRHAPCPVVLVSPKL